MLMKKLSNVHWMGHLLALAILAAVALAGVTGWADALYTLSGNEMETKLNESAQAIVPQLIDVSTGVKGEDVMLDEGMMVTVLHNGTTMRVTAQEESIAQLLARMAVIPSPIEMVGVEKFADHVMLTISDCLTTYEKVTELAPHTTTYLQTPDLLVGTQRIVQPGKDGIRTAIYEQTWMAGEVISRQFVEELSTTAEPAIVEEGTSVNSVSADDRMIGVKYNEDGSGYLTFASGATMRFKEAKTMTATAYTATDKGVNNITATGTAVRQGVAAVDKKVIPLGTQMYVVAKNAEYGMARAEDTGVKGNKIDLYYGTYQECINFGRRSATVYILDD